MSAVRFCLDVRFQCVSRGAALSCARVLAAGDEGLTTVQ